MYIRTIIPMGVLALVLAATAGAQQAAVPDSPELEAAISACTRARAGSACLPLPAGSVRKRCFEECFGARLADLREPTETAGEACVRRYVAADGRTPLVCVLEGAPEKPEPKPTAAELSAAVVANDGPAVDALTRRMDRSFVTTMQTGCTTGCRSIGPKALAAKAQGPTLVGNYKRCMVAADSTREARKLNAYEADLYCDYLRKADARCRDASNCDLLERYAGLRCEYASHGANACLSQ